MDIRDYLPPSLKDVLVYTSQAEREKRKRAAREGFGRPTPVPPASEPPLRPAPAEAAGESESAHAESPWALGTAHVVDKRAQPSAHVARPGESESRALSTARRAPARTLTLWNIALAVLAGLVVAALAILMPFVKRAPQLGGAVPQPAFSACVPPDVAPRAEATPRAVASASLLSSPRTTTAEPPPSGGREAPVTSSATRTRFPPKGRGAPSASQAEPLLNE